MKTNLNPGMEVASESLPPITQAQLKAYADASGDQNPIHQDEAIAKKMGLPGVIAHGMLTAGFLAERAEKFARDSGTAWKITRFQSRFKSMTRLGDVITVGGTVKQVSETDLTLDLQAKNQRGEVTTTASVQFVQIAR